MSRPRYFASPARRSSSATTPKRKRDPEDDGQEESRQSSSGNPKSSSHSYTSMAALPIGLARQFTISGQPYDAELPRPPFPHRSATSEDDRAKSLTLSEVQRGLVALNAPLVHHHVLEGESTLGRQQLSNLSTILHKCLLDRDYVRARRALGLLLRPSARGQPPDIRANGMWGFGADILSQRDKSCSRSDMATDLSVEGFEIARQFYQYLLSQYPFRPWIEGSLTALHFYPAMLGMWIAYIQNKRKASLTSNDRPVDSSDREYTSHGSIHMSPIDAYSSALSSANDLAARLEEMSLLYPHSEDPVIWRLTGMVALWIRDLTIDTLSEPHRSGLWKLRDELGDDTSDYRDQLDIADSIVSLRDQITLSKTAFAKADRLEEKSGSVRTTYI